MRVMVIKQFFGVIDGEIHPRVIEVGEIIDGELGALALKEKWATDVFEERKSEEAKPEGDESSASEAADAPVEAASNATFAAPKTPGAVEIPEDWETRPWFALQKLADTIKGGKVENKAEAKAVIEAELAKRAGEAAKQ